MSLLFGFFCKFLNFLKYSTAGVKTPRPALWFSLELCGRIPTSSISFLTAHAKVSHPVFFFFLIKCTPYTPSYLGTISPTQYEIFYHTPEDWYVSNEVLHCLSFYLCHLYYSTSPFPRTRFIKTSTDMMHCTIAQISWAP